MVMVHMSAAATSSWSSSRSGVPACFGPSSAPALLDNCHSGQLHGETGSVGGAQPAGVLSRLITLSAAGGHSGCAAGRVCQSAGAASG